MGPSAETGQGFPGVVFAVLNRRNALFPHGEDGLGGRRAGKADIQAARIGDRAAGAPEGEVDLPGEHAGDGPPGEAQGVVVQPIGAAEGGAGGDVVPMAAAVQVGPDGLGHAVLGEGEQQMVEIVDFQEILV